MRQPFQQKNALATETMNEKGALCGELYRLCAPRLLAYLCQHLPALHEAEDTLLDVFLVVLEQETYLSALTTDQQRAWIWAVARNKMTDYHRTRQRKPQMPLQFFEEQEDERHTPEQSFLHKETDEQLHRWIRRLTPLQQEVLLLRFAGDLRCPEIALVLNKRPGSIRALMTRALHALRGMYDE